VHLSFVVLLYFHLVRGSLIFMLRYEILILATPEITQDESKQLESHIDTIIRGAQGTVISFDRWGKYRLAYPVKKNDYGIYYLARFEVATAGSLIEDIRMLFKVKLYDIVMRNMITLLDSKDTLEYQRPPSLEEAPARDVASFLNDGAPGAKRGRNRDDWDADGDSSHHQDSDADELEDDFDRSGNRQQRYSPAKESSFNHTVANTTREKHD
jgi:small subunit ribosomal protein S6